MAIAAVIGVATFTLDPSFATRFTDRLAAVHLACAVAALGCLADVWFGDGVRRGARIFVAVGLLVIAAMPVLFPPDPSPAYPPFIHAVTVAALAAPYAVSPAAGVLASVLLAAALLNETRGDGRVAKTDFLRRAVEDGYLDFPS